MRKLFISMALIVSLVPMTRADVTDISALSNVVYIEPVSFPAGTQYALSVKMKNTSLCESFNFSLYLPNGCTVTNVKASDLRKADGAEVDCQSTLKSEGYYDVIVANKQGTTFVGYEGEILLVTVETGRDMAEGTYPVYLKNVSITDDEVYTIYPEDVETTITITEAPEDRVQLDETSTTAPEASNGAVDVRVKRTINANEWSTIVLPFAMNETQVKAAFGDDVQLADFTGTDEPEYDESENVVGVTANFTNVQDIEANHPYIIKVSDPISYDEGFTVDNVNIMPNENKAYIEFDNGKTGRLRVVYSGFYGTYHAQTTLEEFSLFLNDNKFWYSTGLTKMKAFRAYFNFLDILAEVENASSNVKMAIGGEETRIEGLIPETTDESIYDLSGRKVAKAEKGVYIINGKKVLK